MLERPMEGSIAGQWESSPAPSYQRYGTGVGTSDTMGGEAGLIQAKPEGSASGASSVNLTPREHEIVLHLAKGASNSAIAQALSISPTTVKNHLAHVYKKLGVTNRTEAAYRAQKLQWLE